MKADNSKDRSEMAPDRVLYVQTLFVQYMPRIRAFVFSLMPDISKVDDIMQDVFLTVTAKASDFQEGTNFRAWVFSIARFRVLKSMNAMGLSVSIAKSGTASGKAAKPLPRS